MTQDQLQSLAAAKGYKLAGNHMVGSHRGYPFSAVLTTKRISTLTTGFALARNAAPKAVRGIRKALPKGCSVMARNGQLVLICSGKENLADSFLEALDTVTAALAARKAMPPANCPLCKDKMKPCDALALVNGYVPVHRECCQSRAYSKVAMAEVNTIRGSYLTGILGAILAGLIASIPVVLSMWLLDSIYAVLYALIPLGAYYGYKLCRGKMNRGALVIIVLVCIIELFAIEQIIFYIAIVEAYAVYPSILDTVPLYFSLMTFGDIMGDMTISFLFLLLGLWMTFRVIKRTNQSEIQDSSVMLESMMPYRETYGSSEL